MRAARCNTPTQLCVGVWKHQWVSLCGCHVKMSDWSPIITMRWHQQRFSIPPSACRRCSGLMQRDSSSVLVARQPTQRGGVQHTHNRCKHCKIKQANKKLWWRNFLDYTAANGTQLLMPCRVVELWCGVLLVMIGLRLLLFFVCLWLYVHVLFTARSSGHQCVSVYVVAVFHFSLDWLRMGNWCDINMGGVKASHGICVLPLKARGGTFCIFAIYFLSLWMWVRTMLYIRYIVLWVLCEYDIL